MKRETLKALIEAEAKRDALVLVSPLSGGAQELISEHTVGNHACADDIAHVFRTGRSRVVKAQGAEIFLQAFVPKPRLIITGASHIAQILVRLAAEVEIESTIIDPRTAFASEERFAGCTLITEWPGEVLGKIELDRRTGVVCLAHVPDIDDEALEVALGSACFYIGALGSRKSHARRIDRLKSRGITEGLIERIHAPVGLDIGALTPNEIALSVIAEVIATLRAQAGA